MSLVRNKHGAEVCFEVALCYMNDDLRESLEEMGLDKQTMFSMYEIAHEADVGEEWNCSKANPIYH